MAKERKSFNAREGKKSDGQEEKENFGRRERMCTPPKCATTKMRERD